MSWLARAALMISCLALSAEFAQAELPGASPPEGTPIQLSDVPASALSAARKELEAKPSSAKAVTFEGQLAFLVEGTNRYDKHLTVIVAADGTVLKPVNIWDADDD